MDRIAAFKGNVVYMLSRLEVCKHDPFGSLGFHNLLRLLELRCQSAYEVLPCFFMTAQVI